VEDLTVSRTALATSLMRAAHTRLDPNPLIDDPWGDRLVPDSARDMIRVAALARMDAAARQAAMAAPDSIVDESLRRSRAYANVITRTRFAEDALQSAVLKGIRQYVLIGAGFDSFSLRRPAYAADLKIFEIDFPATQSLKIEPVTSELVFTYFDERLLHVQSESFRDMQQRVAALGEPFLSGFNPATLGQDLEECGLELLEDLNGSAVAAKYHREGASDLGQSSFSHIALARVRKA
jgi:O-methyltransferase involved in polyketide biosynthesis